MKSKLILLAVALVAGSTMFAQPRVAIGVHVGGYGPGIYPPPAYVAYQPPCPGPGYSWVDGFYNPYGVWTAGYWRAPVVVAPRYYYGGPRFVGSRYVGGPRYVGAPRYVNSYRGFGRGHAYGRGFRR